MKRILWAGATLLALTAAQPTFAADAPVYKGPAPVAAVLFNWSGFYLGADVGYVWGEHGLFAITSPASGTAVSKLAGISLGGHLGLRHQFANSLVVGIEGDAAWLDGKGPNAPFPGDPTVGVRANLEWSASVRGILGFAMDRSLIYATGGAAWVHASSCGNNLPAPPPCFPGTSVAGTWTGWTIGAGWAYTLSNNLIARIEYLYSDYGTRTFFAPGYAGGNVNLKVTSNVVRAGLSWKW